MNTNSDETSKEQATKHVALR